MFRRSIVRFFAFMVLLGCGVSVFGADAAPYSAIPESKAQRDARMAWFREAKFGLFIHWGVYCVPAGEWKGKKDYGEWFLEQTKMPVSQYEKFRDQFNPVKFDAKRWVAIAKDAGMKYLVITSKHHDGFAMFDTKLTKWGIMSTPFHRDPMKELAAACKEAGLKFCFYHSIMDWHHPDYTPRRLWNDVAAAHGDPDFDRYVQFMKGQLKELTTLYGPLGILWFDGEWEKTWTHDRGKDLYDYVRGLQPDIIVNNRVGKNRAGMQGLSKGNEIVGDYGTPEQEIPAGGLPGVDWESCMTMNNHWGYNKHDQHWKSSAEMIRMLIDIVSKGGNYLLNVGPTSEGLIPEPSVERLREMGRWMKQNGQSIYGATPGPWPKAPAWGRVTQKPGKLYLHVFTWPKNGPLVLPEVKGKKITAAYLLADVDRTPLAVTAAEDRVALALPARAPDPVASVVVLETSAAAAATTGTARCYDWILRDKLRGGYLAASEFRALAQMKATGLNAVMPKFGGLTAPPDRANLSLLRQWGEAARQSGMHFLPVFNLRGGGTERLLSSRREVVETGQRMAKTPCPLDAAFWRTYILGRAVDLASRAKELHIAGAIIDAEMYGADHTMFDTPCYCDDCLREFLQAAGRPSSGPLPTAAARAKWLTKQKLASRFQQHFLARVRNFSSQLERAVHDRDPDFLLGVFHLDIPCLFMRGLAEGLGTEQHPVLGFSETTYGSGYTPYVEKQQKTFASFPAHVLFVPGLWLTQLPSDNLAEQFYACAGHSAGYWVYTLQSLVERGPPQPGYALRESHQRYWAAMRTADTELDRLAASGGHYQSALKVRPFDPPLPVLVLGSAKSEALARVVDEKPFCLGTETIPTLRRLNPLYLLARAGEPVAVKVTNRQFNSHYRSGTQYAVLASDGTQILEGAAKVGQSATAKWTPARDGVYVVLADSYPNGQWLQVLTKQPFGYRAAAERPFRVHGYLGRVYFHVPKGVEKLTVSVKAEGQISGRGGKLAVITPDGHTAARIAGDLGSLIEVPVSISPSMQNRAWALTAEDLTNDLTIHLSPRTASYVSTDPARLLQPK